MDAALPVIQHRQSQSVSGSLCAGWAQAASLPPARLPACPPSVRHQPSGQATLIPHCEPCTDNERRRPTVYSHWSPVNSHWSAVNSHWSAIDIHSVVVARGRRERVTLWHWGARRASWASSCRAPPPCTGRCEKLARNPGRLTPRAPLQLPLLLLLLSRSRSGLVSIKYDPVSPYQGESAAPRAPEL